MVKLRRIAGFGQPGDGRLRAGPFLRTAERTLATDMARNDIFPGEGERPGLLSANLEGVMLSASGAGVRSYFVDSEGIEVDRSNLDALVLETVAPQTPFRVQGHHMIDVDCMVRSDALLIHDGSRVIWSEMRVLLRANGERRILSRAVPLAIVGRTFGNGSQGGLTAPRR